MVDATRIGYYQALETGRVRSVAGLPGWDTDPGDVEAFAAPGSLALDR